MYNSPVKMIIGKMQMQQDGEIFRAVQEIGVNVDKDELLKALKYDRDQYDKGYNDGIKEFAERLRRKVDEDINRCYMLGISNVGQLSLFIDEINNLVKEMTEESNDQQKT